MKREIGNTRGVQIRPGLLDDSSCTVVTLDITTVKCYNAVSAQLCVIPARAMSEQEVPRFEQQRIIFIGAKGFQIHKLLHLSQTI